MNTNNKQTPEPLNESIEYWIGLLGTKGLIAVGGIGGVLSMIAGRAVWKRFRGASIDKKGGFSPLQFIRNLRDKNALRGAGFTNQQIRLLWERDAAVIRDTLKKVQDDSLQAVEDGTMTPERALETWNSCIPKGQGFILLQALRATADRGVKTRGGIASNVKPTARSSNYYTNNTTAATTQSSRVVPAGTMNAVNNLKAVKKVADDINNDPEVLGYFERLSSGESVDAIEQSLNSNKQRNQLWGLLSAAAAAGGIAALLKSCSITTGEDGKKKVVPIPPKPKPTAGGITPDQLKTLTRNQKDAHIDDPMLTYDELINRY